MKHKKTHLQHKKENIKTKTKQEKKPLGLMNPIFIIPVITSLIFAALWLFKPAGTIKEIELAALKGSYAIQNPVKLTDQDTKPPQSIEFANVWDNRLQRINGFVAQFPVRNFPDAAVILDSELKIRSIGSIKPIVLGGKEFYLGSFFNQFSDQSLETLAYNSGIFTPNEEELNKYAGAFKDGLLRTLKLTFIKVNGKEELDKLFPNGITLAAVGDTLKTFEAVDHLGQTIHISDLKKQKTAIIYVDTGCGSCKEKCASIRDLFDGSGVRVIFISDHDELETASFIKDYVRDESVIYDENRAITNLLYLGDPPYLMLISDDLTIIYKNSVSDIAKDAEPVINDFIQ